jgi:putative NADH-flavin reductase
MLIAALLALLVLFGGHGSSFGELMTQYAKDPIKTTIVDKDRRESALKGLSILEDDIAELNKQVSKDLKQFDKLIKDYGSKPEAFDALFSSALAKREVEIEKMWERRNAMLKHIQPDEWQAIMNSARSEMEKAAVKKKKK